MGVRLDVQSNLSSAIADLNKLRDALNQTGQAGKKLKDIQVNDKQLGAAADLFDRVRDNLYAMRKQAESHTVISRARELGHDPDRPLDWIDKIEGFWKDKERSRKEAERFRGRLVHGPDYEPPVSPPAPSEEQPAGTAAGGGMARKTGRWIWNKSIGVVGAAAGIAGVGGLVGMIAEGYREHKALLEGTEGLYKRLIGGTGFDALAGNVRDLGKSLQLTSSEAVRLAETFQETSGATDAEALSRTEQAGRFGRGFGVDPTQSAALFGRAELVGYGNTRQSQRDFAVLLAQTIGQSGMFGRSEQVMEDMIKHIGAVADREGRTASTTEMDKFGSLLSGLYGNPALRGGGAGSILQSLGNLGSGEGNMQQDFFAWLAYGGMAKGDFIRLQKIRDASPFATERDIFGSGDNGKSKLELGWNEVVRQAKWLPGDASDADKQAYMLRTLTGMNMNLAAKFAEIMPQMEANAGGTGAFMRYLQDATGGNMDRLNADALSNLAKLYGGQIDASGLAKRYTGEGAQTSQEDKELLNKLLRDNDTEGLRRELPKVIARTGEESNPARDLDKTMANLSRSIEKELGVHVVDLTKGISSLAATSMPLLGDFLGVASDATIALTTYLEKTAIPAFKEAWERGSSAMRELTKEVKPIGDWLARVAKFLGIAGESPEGENEPPSLINDTQKNVDWYLKRSIEQRKSRQKQEEEDRESITRPDGDPKERARRSNELLGSGKKVFSDPQFMRWFTSRADEMGIPPHEALGLMEQESGGNPLARSKTGPRGLMQLSRGAVQAVGGELDATGRAPYGPYLNAEYGLRYLKKMRDQFGPVGGIQAYNMGPGDYAQYKSNLKEGRDPRFGLKNPDSVDLEYSNRVLRRAHKWAMMGDSAIPKERGAPPIPGMPPLRQLTETPRTDEWLDDLVKRSIAPDFEIPKTPPDTDRTVSSNLTPDQVNARWQGQVAMEVVFKDSRGNVVQKRHGLAVSEPRIPGSGGLSPDTSRFSWNDSVTIPST